MMDWRNKLIRVDKLGKAKRNNVKNQNSEHKQNGAGLIFPTYQKHLDFFFRLCSLLTKFAVDHQITNAVDLLSIYPEMNYFKIYLEFFELEILF
jgi:hypothetical protein